MISQEQAVSRIRGKTAEEIRRLTRARLLGRDVAPVGDGYLDEPAEDLVIQLLGTQDIGESVLDGCMEVYGELLSRLASLGQTPLEQEWAAIAVRLCRVVDVVSPQELESHADSLLTLALANRSMESNVVRAAVRASMAYELGEDHVRRWKSVLERREVAAYGFNALLKINPHAERIVESLKVLWRRQVLDEWPVDTAFLMRRAAREQRSTDVIARVLSSLRTEDHATPEGDKCWPKVKAEVERRAWSRKWLDFPVGSKDVRPSPVMLDIDSDNSRLAVSAFNRVGQPSGKLLSLVEHASEAEEQDVAITKLLNQDARRRLIVYDQPNPPDMVLTEINLYTLSVDFGRRADLRRLLAHLTDKYRIDYDPMRPVSETLRSA